MLTTYLEFEKPLAELDQQITALAGSTSAEARRELARLRKEMRRLERDLYGSLTPWQRVQLSRHTDRPQTGDYLRFLCADFFPLRGDRACAEDPAIVGGIARYRERTVIVLGVDRHY